MVLLQLYAEKKFILSENRDLSLPKKPNVLNPDANVCRLLNAPFAVWIDLLSSIIEFFTIILGFRQQL